MNSDNLQLNFQQKTINQNNQGMENINEESEKEKNDLI